MLPLRKVCRLFACLCLLSPVSYAQRPYTVDDMLRLEEIGKVRFDPTGQHLIFERYGPFDRQSSYGREEIRGELRSKIYSALVDSSGEPRLLFEQNPHDSYALNSVSSDGTYVAFDHSSVSQLREGVAHLATGVVRDFAFSPDYRDEVDAPWIRNGIVPYSTLEPGHYPLAFSLHVEEVAALESKWRAARDGTASTASELGSGRYASFPGRAQSLTLGNASDGTSRLLGHGQYGVVFPSSDGGALAALREDKLPLDPQHGIEHGANMGGIQRALLVYELAGQSEAVQPCKGCDILRSSLNWSPDGRYLAFVAREPAGTWATPSFWIFDRRKGQARRQSLGALKPHLGRNHGFELSIRSTWLGNQLAVLLDHATTRDDHATAARNVRADWYLLGRGKPIQLTGAFTGETPELIATSSNALILLHQDKAWQVDAQGQRRDLTPSVLARLEEWRQPSRYGPRPHFNMQPVSTLVLQTRPSSDAAAKSVYFVELSTGKVERVPFPSIEAQAVDVSVASHRVAFLDSASHATILAVAEAGGNVRQILSINDYLKEIVPARPVRIDHPGPSGTTLHSWLLLPPGTSRGARLPTVVNVYPGSSCAETFNRWEINEVHALNDQILAGHGYAVLYPCVPVNYEEVPRDPLRGLAERVLAPVDVAIAQGYVDPERLAVQGQSYGGYTTGALVGQTHRFKSAVAQAGIYDLISSYGQFDERMRLDVERVGLSLFGASLAETSQTGMGAPPWKDPERYLRNSPLMHVESIETPILLINGDRDYVSTTQSEEFFTALTRLNKDAVYVRYYGEDHVFNSPANIRDMWKRIFTWYEKTLGPPAKMDVGSGR